MKRSKTEFMQNSRTRMEIMNAIRNQERKAMSPFSTAEDRQKASVKIAELNGKLVDLNARSASAMAAQFV